MKSHICKWAAPRLNFRTAKAGADSCPRHTRFSLHQRRRLAASFNSGLGETSPVRQKQLTFLWRRFCQGTLERPGGLKQYKQGCVSSGPSGSHCHRQEKSGVAAETRNPAIFCLECPGPDWGQIALLPFRFQGWNLNTQASGSQVKTLTTAVPCQIKKKIPNKKKYSLH